MCLYPPLHPHQDENLLRKSRKKHSRTEKSHDPRWVVIGELTVCSLDVKKWLEQYDECLLHRTADAMKARKVNQFHLVKLEF